MSILIRGGILVTPSDTYQADVLIQGDTIGGIGADLAGSKADRVVDATGLYVMPGGIDVHCHFQLEFGGTVTADDFESGTIAAAFGGTTCVVDMALQEEGKPLRDALERWHQRAVGKAAIDYSFHACITDPTETTLAEMEGVVSEGVTSFKEFLAYPGELMIEDDALLRILQNAKRLGAVVILHAENGRVTAELARQAIAAGNSAPAYYPMTRPPETEAEAVERAITLAGMVGTPIHFFHVSSMMALQRIRAARDRGLPVFAETCPHYLFLTEERYAEPESRGAKYICSPPLRTKQDQNALWHALAGGDLQVVSSDHCPYQFHGQKDRGLSDFRQTPGGLPSIETRLPLVYSGGVATGRMSVNRFVEVVATNPAKIFGLHPRKGTLVVGSDADLVLWDPMGERVITVGDLHIPVDYTPFEGIRVSGFPRMVISHGGVVVEDGEFVGKPGAGRFIARGRFDPSIWT